MCLNLEFFARVTHVAHDPHSSMQYDEMLHSSRSDAAYLQL